MRYENREGGFPSTATLMKIADLLNTTIDEVVKLVEYDVDFELSKEKVVKHGDN